MATDGSSAGVLPGILPWALSAWADSEMRISILNRARVDPLRKQPPERCSVAPSD